MWKKGKCHIFLFKAHKFSFANYTYRIIDIRNLLQVTHKPIVTDVYSFNLLSSHLVSFHNFTNPMKVWQISSFDL